MNKKILTYVLFYLCTASLYTQTQNAAVTIKTTPEEADVYINAQKYGTTPLTISPLRPGHYLFHIEKEGYYDYDFTAEIPANMDKEFSIQLERITGKLKVSSNIDDITLLINGEKHSGRSAVLPEGLYNIEVQKFGYTAYRKTVQITQNIETDIQANLQKADFDVSGFAVGKTPFNPANPGSLGSLRISFSVTAPGTGTIRVKNSNNDVCFVIGPEYFSTWDHVYYWNGKNCADGAYTITLEAQETGIAADGMDSTADENASIAADGTDSTGAKNAGGQTVIREKTAVIDSSILYPFGILSSSGAGTGLSPSARLYPAGTWCTMSKAEQPFSIISGTAGSPSVSLSVLHTVLPFLEVSAHAASVFSAQQNTVPFAAGASIKAGISSKTTHVFAAAFSAFYHYNSAGSAFFQKDTGAGSELSASIMFGIFTAGLSTGVRAGNEFGLFLPSGNSGTSSESVSADNSFPVYWKNTISAGIQYKSFTAGVWGALLISDDRSIGGAAGLDVSYIIPQTSIMVFLQGSFFTDDSPSLGIECSGGFAVIL